MFKLFTTLAAVASASVVDFDAPAVSHKFVSEVNNAKGRTEWTAALSPKFMNMTLREAQRLMGSKRDPVRRAALPVSDITVPSALPSIFNATKAWPQCANVIGHIRDQSDCKCFFGWVLKSLPRPAPSLSP